MVEVGVAGINVTVGETFVAVVMAISGITVVGIEFVEVTVNVPFVVRHAVR